MKAVALVICGTSLALSACASVREGASSSITEALTGTSLGP
jgi:hypothetical protein